jgi:hypothetical protein
MPQHLTFICYHCNKESKFSTPKDNSIHRLHSEQGPQIVSFLCEHCGNTNEIELTAQVIQQILGSFLSRGGDIGGLFDIFKK